MEQAMSDKNFEMPPTNNVCPIDQKKEHQPNSEQEHEPQTQSKGQFSNEAVNTQEQTELEATSPMTEQLSEEKPIKRKKGGVIKKTIISTLVLGALGGVVWLGYETGIINDYIIRLTNSAEPEVVISELDNQQNKRISEAALRINDLEKLFTNNDIIEKLNQLSKDSIEYRDLISKNSSDLALLGNDLNTRIDKFESSQTTMQHELTSLLGQTESRLLGRIGKVNDRVDEQLGTIKSFERQMSSTNKQIKKLKSQPTSDSTSSKTVTQKTTKPVIQKRVIEAPEKPQVIRQEISSYSGLTIVNIFPWSTQHIAVLTDNAGSTFQITKGQRLGQVSVTEIDGTSITLTSLDGLKVYTMVKPN